jgi:hypothetical protein
LWLSFSRAVAKSLLIRNDRPKIRGTPQVK